VEVGVLVAQRWILARLRHETFFSLAALNARIRELLTGLNARPMKGYGGVSRRDLFERFDQPALQPLPAERFVYTEWSKATVNIFGVLPSYVVAIHTSRFSPASRVESSPQLAT
jgi:hypothetical protein